MLCVQAHCIARLTNNIQQCAVCAVAMLCVQARCIARLTNNIQQCAVCAVTLLCVQARAARRHAQANAAADARTLLRKESEWMSRQPKVSIAMLLLVYQLVCC
jgi:hypothetical protein